MASSKIAVVTGSNKGIGLSVVKNIAKSFDGIVYLTARNEELGKKALKELEDQGLKNVRFHQLDISSISSINAFESYLKLNHGRLDILVNNAAMIDNPESKLELKCHIEEIVNLNYFGTLNLCNALFPLLKPNSRVVNVTSDWGFIYYVRNENIRNKLVSVDNIDDLSLLMKEFINGVKTDLFEYKCYDGYKTSKAGLHALTRLQQKELNKSIQGVIVSSVNPGDVKTDMNQGGNLTPDQGAETIVYLSLLSENENVAKGEFWYKMKSYDWSDIKLDLVDIFGAIYELENVNVR